MPINNSKNDDLVPFKFYLSQNYPNPFKEKTIIKYCVAYNTRIQIAVYNHDGDVIEKLVDEIKRPGTYETEFSAVSSHSGKVRKLPPGYYCYCMIAGDYTSEKKWLCINHLIGRLNMKALIQTLFFFLLVQQICLGQGTWTKIGDMPEIRYAHTADEINGKVYITGGVNTEQGAYPTTMLVYDKATSTWSTIPLPGNSLRGQHTSCVVDSNLYIIGGGILLGGTVNSTDSMYMFKPSTGEWIAKNPMPTDRQTLACALLDGKIYVAGGLHVINGVPNYNGLKTFEVYDLATETWSTLPDMPTYRWGLSVVAFEGKIYVLGGRGISIRPTAVDVYDPQDSSWTTAVTNIPTPRYQLATCVVDSNIYAIDGWYSSGSGPIYDTVEVYNPITDVWTTGTSMPVAVAMLDGYAFDGKIYMYGGSYTTHPNIGISDIWEFTPSLPAGTYTVGTGGNFETIQEAFNKLETNGIAGNVILKLIDELYIAPTDSFGFKLNGPIPGAGPNSRVSIKPADNKNVIIEGSGRATLSFLNTSYLTIDGVELSGPTTLTIRSLVESQFTWINSAVFYPPAVHNIVENVTFNNENYLKGVGLAFMSFVSTTSPLDSNLIQNNFIKKASIGIYVSGWSGIAEARYNIVSGNVIGSESDSLITWGIQIEGNNNSIIENNRVENIKQQFALNITTHGINIVGCNSCTIRNNVVHKVRSQQQYGSSGILLSGDGTFGYGNNNLVYNNMIYDIQSTSVNPNSRVAGIQLWYQNNAKIYYNTVHLSGTGGSSPGGSAALFMASSGTVTNLDVKNNILVNTRDETPYCASSICDYSSAIFTSDYNDLFYESNQYNCLVRAGGIDYLTLAQWQATGKDINSITEMPNFVEPDLHIDFNIYTLLDGHATPITGITTDIDNEPRNAVSPDIGADEFVYVPVELTSFTATTNGNEIVLNWSTATETNNQGFSIERKSSGSEYSEIGFVPGFGTTTEIKSYSFIDSKVSASKYIYRLKQIDFDGSFEYSPEVEVEVSIQLEFSLEQNYPNPFNPSTKISWQSPVGSQQTLKIYDILGNEVVALVDEYKPAGRYEVEFSASKLPSGVYFYQLKAGVFVETKKMLLLK